MACASSMIDGKRQVPTPALPEGADLGGLPVTFGLGGLHSIDGAGRADSDAGHVLWNVDVASYYPALMMKPAGAPVHLDGAVYRTIFGGILSRRLEAKRPAANARPTPTSWSLTRSSASRTSVIRGSIRRPPSCRSP